MDRYRAMRLSGIALMLAGIAMMIWAAVEGQLSFALVLIIPIIIGTGPLAAISFLSIFAGMVLAFLSFFKVATRVDTTAEPMRTKKEWGGVILIGPIPIIIGSPGMLKGRGAILLLAGLSLIVLALFLLTVLR
jgi:uncharacterized membrane protein